MMKTIRSKSLSRFSPACTRTRLLLCLITAIFVVSGAAGDLCSSEVVTGKSSWFSTEACTEPHKKIYTKDCLTASGRSLYVLEKEKRLFAASWAHPFGTKVRVTNIKNSRSVVVAIVDRGPSKNLNRVIDLGKDAFRTIADARSGIIDVRVEVLP